MTGDAVARGGAVLAVTLDIANAFNTLPWNCFREALRYHRMTTYLCGVIEASLTDRVIIYPTSVKHRYDWVLHADLSIGVSVISYAVI